MNLLIALAVDCRNIPEAQIPIILVHGLMKDKNDMYMLRDLIHRDFPERKLFCPNLLLGVLSSLFESYTRYARALASEINKFLTEEAPEAQCIDIVGHSQGGFFSRIFTQLYSGVNTQYSHYVKVRRLYSLAGVMGGFYCEQKCGPLNSTNPLLKMFNWISKPSIVYSRFSMMIFTPIAEWKDVTLSKYYATSKTLLCIANKECVSDYDVRTELSELDLMVNFWTPDDQIISPPDSEIFNFYLKNSNTVIQDVYDTVIYSEIGLDALKNYGRWKRVQVPGFAHRSFIDQDVDWFYEKCFKRYLANDFSTEDRFESICE